ncbi:MAG: 16S rRNA processing protein RimM [Rhodospirillaceae bacterium]|nr:MAG: 16S rRNA processing protein RimM [Rhodospirillaceae bacterium]
MERKVCVGAVVGAKGVRGEVKIKSFTATPGDVGAYGPVTTEDGRTFQVRVSSWAKDIVTAQLAGVADRNAAEALTGVRLYVDRAALPAAEDGSYYHADLIGLTARLTDGEVVGKVSAVFNFGAGDMLEVTRPGGATELIPFTGPAIAGVDVAAGTVTIAPLPGLFADDLSTAVEGEAE